MAVSIDLRISLAFIGDQGIWLQYVHIAVLMNQCALLLPLPKLTIDLLAGGADQGGKVLLGQPCPKPL